MAGFMAGFGEAFSTSYREGRKRQAEKEENDIARRFEETMASRKEQFELRQEDKRIAQRAKEYTQQLNDQIARDDKVYSRERNDTLSDKASLREETLSDRVAERTQKDLDAASTERKDTAEREDQQTHDLKKLEAQEGYKRDEKTRELGVKEQELQGKSKDLGGLYGLEKEVHAEIYRMLKNGTDVEALLKGGWRPESLKAQEDSKTETETTDPMAVNSPEVNPASQQTKDMMTPPAINPEVKWKEPDNSASYSENELVNRLATETDPVKKERLQKMADAQLAHDAMKSQNDASARGQNPVPQAVIMRDPDGKGKIVSAKKDSSGQWVDRRTGQPLPANSFEEIDPAMFKAMDEMSKQNKTTVDNFEQRALQVAGSVDTAMKMKEILSRNPTANTAAGTIAQKTDEWARDVTAGMSELTSIVSTLINNGDPVQQSNGVKAVEEKAKALEEKINGLLSQGVQDTALDAALLDSYRLRMTYASLATVGQEGKAINKDEFEKTYNDLGNSNATIVKKKLDEIIDSSKTSLKTEHDLLNKYSSDAERFNTEWNVEALPITRYPNEILDRYKPEMEQGVQGTQKITPSENLPQGWTSTGKFTDDGREIVLDPQGRQKARKVR